MLVSGVVLMCIGISVQTKLHDTFTVVNEDSSGLPVIIAIVGGVITSISIFGVIAVLKSSHMLLKLFTGLLLIMFLIEFIVGIAAFAYREKLHDNLLRGFLKALDKYDRESQITKEVDTLQENFQCCGAQNYTDWFNTTFGSLRSTVPKSCCKIPTESCGMNLTNDATNVYQQGCVQKLKKWAEEHTAVIGGVGMSVGFAQLLGIVFSYMLLRILEEDYVNL